MYSKDDLLCFNILEAANSIIEFTKEFNNVDDWKNNKLHYDATMMNFIVIGEMTTKISEEFKDENPDIEWHKMYGFRNIMAHDYFGIEERLVWDVIQTHIPVLKIQIEKILN
jgi:uncharacterized protein with HEPN domain